MDRTVDLPVKIAVLSQQLPPSPYGGAVLLYRMFKDLNPDDYCLLSDRNYEEETHPPSQGSSAVGSTTATPRLPTRYYRLPTSSPGLGDKIEEDSARDGSPLTAKSGSGLESPLAKSIRSRMPGWLKPQAARKLINDWRTARRLIREVLRDGLRRAHYVKHIVKREKCGAIVACSGDPFDLLAGYLASRVARVPFYAYLFDDYRYQWKHTPYRYLAQLIEPFVLRGAEGVLVLNEFLADEYRRRHRIEPVVIHVPFEIPEKIEDGGPAPWPVHEGEIEIVYTGAIYHAHYDAFHNLLAAIDQLGHPGVKLHLYTAQSGEDLEREGISGPIVHHGHIASSEVFEVQRRADILFLPLAFSSPIPEVVKTSIPSKTGEYLASGRPILVHAPADSFVSWYFRKHECGLLIEQSDPKMLAKAIERISKDAHLRRRITKNARASAEDDFSLTSARGKFLELLRP